MNLLTNSHINSKRTVLASALMAVLVMTGCNQSPDSGTESNEPAAQTEQDTSTEAQDSSAETQASAEVTKLLTNYSDIAHATYQDSLDEAKKLQAAIDAFVAEPTEANLDAAKAAYKAARQPYSQSEIFRFDEGFVGEDDERKIGSVDGWEGQLNAWPLDEALIDYVSSDYSGEYSSADNIINSDSITVGSTEQDTSTITPELLADMNEIGGSEANVTTGYHAIEFLLWGQDTNGVGEGAGQRPVSDYYTNGDSGECTSGDTTNDDTAICQKRGEYLKAAAQLLVSDLTDMVAQWQPDSEHTLRSDLMSRANTNGVRQVMYQMGSLALGELASERMQVAFVTGSTEDEHECFSDLTHLSYMQNAQGIRNVFEGSYSPVSGDAVGGYGLKQYLVDTGHKEDANTLEAQFTKVSDAFNTIVDQGENNGVKVDQMIATVGQASEQGVSEETQTTRRGWVENAIMQLQTLTDDIETAASSLGINNLDADSGSQF